MDIQQVTIQVQKRNGKKCITSIFGLATDLDTKKIVSHLKKTLKCNGHVIDDEKHGEVISLSGDQRAKVFHFFVHEQIYKSNEIIIKGI